LTLKKKIKDKKYKDKNIIEYFNNSINNIDALKIIVIDYIDVESKKELNKYINEYRNKNNHMLFYEYIYCDVCNESINKKLYDSHLT